LHIPVNDLCYINHIFGCL